MKNSDLKVVLQKMLDEGEVDVSTIGMLQDASVHAAMKLDLPLEGIALTYYILAAGHQMMKDLLGIDMSKMDVIGDSKQPDLTTGFSDLFLGTPPVSLDDAKRKMDLPNPEKDKHEKDLLNAILKDLDINL